MKIRHVGAEFFHRDGQGDKKNIDQVDSRAFAILRLHLNTDIVHAEYEGFGPDICVWLSDLWPFPMDSLECISGGIFLDRLIRGICFADWLVMRFIYTVDGPLQSTYIFKAAPPPHNPQV